MRRQTCERTKSISLIPKLATENCCTCALLSPFSGENRKHMGIGTEVYATRSPVADGLVRVSASALTVSANAICLARPNLSWAILRACSMLRFVTHTTHDHGNDRVTLLCPPTVSIVCPAASRNVRLACLLHNNNTCSDALCRFTLSKRPTSRLPKPVILGAMTTTRPADNILLQCFENLGAAMRACSISLCDASALSSASGWVGRWRMGTCVIG